MHHDRHIRIRSVRCETPDLRKLSTAVIALAQAQLEKEAEAEHRQQARLVSKPPKSRPRQRPKGHLSAEALPTGRQAFSTSRASAAELAKEGLSEALAREGQ